MREPSIHLTRKHLILVLKDTFVNGIIDNKAIIKLAEDILIYGKRYSATHRHLKVDTAKLYKSTSKIMLSTRDDAGVFNNILNLSRKKRKHTGIEYIKVGTFGWNMVKEIASLAMSFCNDFNLKREEGFKLYIDMALDRMNGFKLTKFNTLHQSICNTYESTQKIKLDITPERTSELKNIYDKYLGEKTGIVPDYSKEPDKYVYFIKAKEEADKLGVKYEHYIDSQFKGLEWCNSYPDPSQLIGKGAIERLNKYLIKRNIKPKEDLEVDRARAAGEWLKQQMEKNNNDKRKGKQRKK